MHFLARVYVRLKPTVNDPQGETVLGALKSLGFAAVTSVRMGKYLEVSCDGSTQAEAQETVQQMCQRLLANPVIEQFHFDLVEQAPTKASTP